VEEITETPAQDVLFATEFITPQISPFYRAELAGLASGFNGGEEDNPNDGVVSLRELYFLHLIPDLFRTSCSAISVYGDRSFTGSPLTGYLMDFPAAELLAPLHAVTLIKNGGQSLALLGFLGMFNASSIVNDDGVFMGHLDSRIAAAEFRAYEKRSMLFDIRAAFEQATTLHEVSKYFTDQQKTYTFGFVLSLADPNGAGILEVDQEHQRTLRDHAGQLHPGIAPWRFSGAVAAVNAFLLSANTDNYTREPVNEERWNSYIEQLAHAGDRVTWDELRQIVTFDHGDGPDDFLAGTGDIYNQWTITITMFRPKERVLDMFFRTPHHAILPENPDFIRVPINFE
jgi:hypothetical protein